ncbi:MAG TPA: DICT sensory domain-containing protein [Pyrinomonadaceae bacterium]|nr:DICT sensory domain-containing protein [Pyrinomonadaceae bacterium]
MKNYSIFEQALKFSGVEETENLGEIASLARRDFIEHESFICHTTTASVEYACLMIENALLLRTNRAGRVYAGVEKFSALQPIIDRYMRIADISESVYLFGEDDWRPPRHPNIRLVPLKHEFRLAREWFVITHSPSLNCALVAYDEGAIEASLSEQIRYWALKTSNPDVVHSLARSVEGVIDWTLAA